MLAATADSKDDKLTAEEAKQLEDAFKDETFCKLMADYVNELSDPKYKEEQEAYIAQLEAQNEVPFGKALVRPSSGFAVKCTQQKKRGADANKSKLFLNMVHSEDIAEPVANKSDMCGSNWSVPFAIGPLRMEHDKSDNLVATFDCCFHPLSLRYAHERNEVLNLIVDIAKDAVCSAFKKSGDEIEILPGYIILRGVRYKSGTPKALLVSSNSNKDKKHEAGHNRGLEVTASSTLPSDVQPIVSIAKSCVATDVQPIVPKYKIVEQGVLSSLSLSAAEQSEPVPQRPKSLIVHVYLDKATPAANLNLDVSERELVIKHDSKCKYSLELQLPYAVKSQNGNARFDKNTNVLIVTLPTL